MSLSLTEKALLLAIRAHEGQVRKTDGSPYVVHPIMVAMKLARYGFSETIVAGALVHDVIEDTSVGADEIEKELGVDVLKIVDGVSEDKTLEWEARKEKYAEKIKVGSEGIKAVSVSDKIHNLESIVSQYETQGAALWKKFNRGKEQKIWFERLVLDALKTSWSHPLVDEYEMLIEKVESLAD